MHIHNKNNKTSRTVQARRLLAAMSAAFLCACAELDPQTDKPGDIPCGSVPVTFDAFGKWPDEPGTRAVTSGASPSFESGDAIGVTAYWIKDGGSIADTAPNFMYNQKVTYSAGTVGDESSSGTWLYSPVKYWPVSGKVDFYAYYPYAQAGDGRIVLSGNTDTGKPTLTYTNSAADIDLMAASSKGLSLAGGSPSAASPAPVFLGFHHLLARVRFTFSYIGTASYEPVVQMVKFGKVPYVGVFDFSTCEWNIEVSKSSDVKRFTHDVAGVVINGQKQLVDDFTCYLLPESVISGEIILAINNLKCTYSVPSDKAFKVEQGKTYTLHFNIEHNNNGNYFITSFLLWEDGGDYEGELK